MNQEFLDHLNKFSTNPYLFIGSGLSRRYLTLPTWEELLNQFFVESKIEGNFEYYQSKSNGSLPKLASILASEFHEIWWKNPVYKDSMLHFKSIAKEKENIPLKIEISNYLAKIQKINLDYSNEIDLLKNAVIDGIITTNWDDFLENNFVDFNVYIGQQELLFSESISVGEIYKIHGCTKQPQSLIITEEDYNEFNNRNAYLAAKLLTIFVEHPVIFIGYSLSDENIQKIIDSIVNCVDSKNLDKLKDRLIFIEWKSGSSFEIKDGTIKLPENKVLPIKLITTDSFEPVFETLTCLKRHIPVKILRKIRNSVVEYVKNSKTTTKVYIKDIETINEDTEIEFAIGIGVVNQFISAQGYKAINALDIIEDVIIDSKKYDSERLINNTFPTITKSNTFVPIFRYLRELGYLNKNAYLNNNGEIALKNKFKLKPNMPNCFFPPKNYMNKQPEIRRNYKDVESIVNFFDRDHALLYIPLLNFKNIDNDQLLSFLRICLNDEKINKSTSFRKLVCLFDYLKYGIG